MILWGVVFGLGGEADVSESEREPEFHAKRNKKLISTMEDKSHIRDKPLLLIDKMIKNGIIT